MGPGLCSRRNCDCSAVLSEVEWEAGLEVDSLESERDEVDEKDIAEDLADDEETARENVGEERRR